MMHQEANMCFIVRYKGGYVAGSTTVQEGVWLRRLLREFGIVARGEEPVTIYCDSLAANAYSKDPKYHRKIKHKDIRYHFVRHVIEQKEVILRHISASRMVVDPLTKPIPHHIYQGHVKSLGLHTL